MSRGWSLKPFKLFPSIHLNYTMAHGICFLLLRCQVTSRLTASLHTPQLFKESAVAPNYSSPGQTRSSGQAHGALSTETFICLFSYFPSSVGPPSLRSYCFCLSQGLLCFSSSWHWLHKLRPDPLPSSPPCPSLPPPCPTTLPGSYPLGAPTKPSVLITLWNWS